MKNGVLILFVLFNFGATALACSMSTLNSITSPIDPYYDNRVGQQVESALSSLSLCDENSEYGARLIGLKFDPYYTFSTGYMVESILPKINNLSVESALGLGFSVINKIDLYYSQSTEWMTYLIVELAKSRPQNAKQFALALLAKQDSYYREANQFILNAVEKIQKIAFKVVQAPSYQVGSIWAFRSENETCDYYTTPWGRYSICPKYTASVSDQFGNRIILTCHSENFGIEFRLKLAGQSWANVAGENIQSLGFGSGQQVISLGVPYLVRQDKTLVAEEVLSPEMLWQLKSASKLEIKMRVNSGEKNVSLNFPLKGSNQAISRLLQYCQ